MAALPRIDNAERVRVFGPPCTTANHRTYLTPWGLRVQVHFLVAPRFAAACALAKRSSSWTPLRADSYACRPIRGSEAQSLHSWALATDWFATPPTVEPPGGVWTPDDAVPPAFAAAFEWYGFTWGANFTRRDVPHIEWAAGRPEPLPAPAPVPTPQPPATWEADLPKPTDFTSACVDPVTGGHWEQTAEGGVNGYDGAFVHGSYKDHPDLGGSVRYFTAIIPSGKGGYVQIANDGARYRWDPKS